MLDQVRIGGVPTGQPVVVVAEGPLGEQAIGTELVPAGLRAAVEPVLEARHPVEVGAVRRLLGRAGAHRVAQQEVAPQQLVELRPAEAASAPPPRRPPRPSRPRPGSRPASRSRWTARGMPTRAWTACPNSCAITSAGRNRP